MNTFEIEGKIHTIFDPQQVTETFRKREFVLEIDDGGGYIQHVKFQTVQQRCELLDQFQAGDYVKVRFSLTGRPYTRPDGEVIYFTNLKAWAIEPIQTEQSHAAEPESDSDLSAFNSPEEEDELPF